MKVTVLGAGSWGTTVAALLCRRDHEVLLWARNPEVAAEVDGQRTNAAYLPDARLPARLRATADLEQAARHADLLVVGVPTGAFRDTLERVRPHLAPWIPVVSLSKGLERDTHLRMTEVIKEVLPGRPAAALTGPNLAKEIMAGQAAASVIATEDLTVAAALQREVQRGHVPRLHPPRRRRLRDRRRAQERHRHRHRHGPGPGRRRQHASRR